MLLLLLLLLLLLQGEDRRKFKTRSGEMVRLVDVLEEARDKARAILVERRAAGTTSLTTDAEIEHAAAVLGYGGVKYFDLKQVRCAAAAVTHAQGIPRSPHTHTCPRAAQHRLNDYVFSFERMLASDGDTAVYLEYALVRVASIIRKAREAGVDVDAALSDAAAPLTFTHGSEVRLLRGGGGGASVGCMSLPLPAAAGAACVGARALRRDRRGLHGEPRAAQVCRGVPRRRS